MLMMLTLESRNVKVGAMPVSTSPNITCPDACPLKKSGCYAEHGPLGIIWRALSASTSHIVQLSRGVAHALSWDSFCEAIADLAEGAIWRHNQAGDLPGENNEIDVVALDKLVQANRGRRGFTYTHKPLTGQYGTSNSAAIKSANDQGFTINLSADNLREADELTEANVGPVVVVLPVETQRAYDKNGWLESLEDYRTRTSNIRTPNGVKVAPCPATYQDGVSCITCQLCQRQTRKCVVGFPAHGAAKRKASNVASESVA